jgi:BASS family bile acid:Na+ symporter
VTVIDVAIPLITFLALTAVGMDLTPADFRAVRERPAILLAGLLAPVAILPLLTIGLLALFSPSHDVGAGLLLVASCPIGGISNTYSYLARASTALSVTLTAISSAIAVVTIPLISWGFAEALGRPMAYRAPSSLPAQLALVVLLPVLTGMFLRHQWPDTTVGHRGTVQRAAFAGLALLLVLIITNDPDAFVGGLHETVPLATAFVLLSFGAGWMVGASLAAPRPVRFTLASEFATRNVGVATAIAVTLIGQPAFALFGATYFLTELPLMLLIVLAYRSRPSPAVTA